MAKRKNAGTPAEAPAARKKTARELSEKNAALISEFRAAHAEGMAALKRHDYAALETVITEEAEIIAKQSKLITASRGTVAKAKRKR